MELNMKENDAFQYFAYSGFAFWLVLLIVLIKWRLRDIYYFEKANKDKLVEGKNDVISSRLSFYDKSVKIFNYILYVFRFTIILLSILIIFETIFGSVMSKNFIASNLTMVCGIIPSYFGVMLCKSVFSDMAKVIKKVKCGP